MIYRIAHAEVVRLWTYWEVEADSYDEAVEKLEKAGVEIPEVENAMLNGFDESCSENELLEIADAYACPLSLYLKEEAK